MTEWNDNLRGKSCSWWLLACDWFKPWLWVTITVFLVSKVWRCNDIPPENILKPAMTWTLTSADTWIDFFGCLENHSLQYFSDILPKSKGVGLQSHAISFLSLRGTSDHHHQMMENQSSHDNPAFLLSWMTRELLKLLRHFRGPYLRLLERGL